MNHQGLLFQLEPFTVAPDCQLRTGHTPEEADEFFRQELAQALTEQGLRDAQLAVGQPDVTVRGEFTCLNEGSRLARYMTHGMLGRAAAEVRADVLLRGTPIARLHVQAAAGNVLAVFGGSSRDLVANAVSDAAGRLAGQVVETLEREPG